jgi:hypothetical protein
MNCFIFFFVINLFCVETYYCSAADSNHFSMVKNLIGSIHKEDPDAKKILIFNLGLSDNEIEYLNSLKSVFVKNIKQNYSYLTEDFLTSEWGRKVKGYFTWKPIVIKEALDECPYVLYLDSGTMILKDITPIFECIIDQGYYLLSCTNNENCNVVNRITNDVKDFVIKKFNSHYNFLMDKSTTMIDAGLQGINKNSEIYNKYLIPVYNLASNINLFKDDGSALFGYGAGRHDQTLFTIYAHILNLNIFPEGFFNYKFNTYHTHWDRAEINNKTLVYRCRNDIQFNGGRESYIIKK